MANGITQVDFGGKANSLIKLRDAGFNVPAFVVFSEEELNDTDKVNANVTQTLEGQYYAVRSSANMEDGSAHSFAGIFESVLFVTAEKLNDAVQEVASSKHSDTLKAYVKLNNLQLEDIKLNVVVQEMIDADVSGVAFGLNPVKPYRKSKLASSVYGLGEGLVSGKLTADTYTFSQGTWTSDIADKQQKLTYENDKLQYLNLPENQKVSSSLNQDQLNTIEETLSQLENLYGSPQDIEFCFKGDTFFLLQSRPITTAKIYNTHIIWDNSNIIESYPGITSPFTFSFIQDVYESVYKSFGLLLGVPKAQVEANKEVFATMLGHIKGRVYYHLIHWYKALAMLPMYSINASFMEKMMGVSEPLGIDFELKKQPGKAQAYFNTIRTLIKLIRLNKKLPQQKEVFTQKVNETILQFRNTDNSNKTKEEVWTDYQRFKDILINEWSPPLANDLFAMIYFGSLQKVCTNWLNNDSLHVELVIGKHEVKSTLPAKLVNRIIKQAIDDGVLEITLKTSTSEEVWALCKDQKLGETGRLILEYIELYGDRSVGELKLENITYRQKPTSFIDVLKTYSLAPEVKHIQNTNNASKQVDQLPWNKRLITNYLIKKAAETVADRENLRFDRTFAFGVVRKLVREMGEKLVSHGYLNHVQEVFYLTEKELGNVVNTQPDQDEIKKRIHNRIEEEKEYQKLDTLPERIHQYDDELDIEYVLPDTPGQLKGIACCAGEVTGSVRVLSDPTQVGSLNGDILVTTSTDPGWITIFQSASAILVERGSTLSHAAIVSREMGIPCIVGIKGLTQSLSDGDRVKMDGKTGLVLKIDDE